MKVKILMIDDHPSMIEGYKIILSYNQFGYEIETTAVHNCEKAYEIITKKRSPTVFDVFFLDYSLPPFEKKNISNGEDLALLIKKHFPESKIILLTSHTESILLYNLIKKVKPNGLLVKSDFTADELLTAFDVVVKEGLYYSQTVKKIIKDLSSSNLYLDTKNRQIIQFMSQGTNTKSLARLVNLSISAIEKRKVFIKEYFDIQKGNDQDIIQIARKQGLV